MTPAELTTLYSPFLICWFLIWLTNMAESMPTDVPTQSKPTRRPMEKKETNHEDEPHAKRESHTLEWNVSSFFGFRDERGAL